MIPFCKSIAYVRASKELTASERDVLDVLVTYAQENAEQITRGLSYADINAEQPRISLRTVKNAVAKIEKLGYIEVIRKGAPLKNQYRVLLDIPKQAQEKQDQQEQKQEKNNRQKRSSNKLPCNEHDIEGYAQAMLHTPFLN